MALINCSECRKEISDKAGICPHCGNPINGQRTTNVQQEVIVKEKGEGCFLQTLNAGCIVFVVIIVLIIILIALR